MLNYRLVLPLFFALLILLFTALIISDKNLVINDTLSKNVLGKSNTTQTDGQADLLKLNRKTNNYRVGLQAGHWKAEELPDELAKLRTNKGAVGGGKYEAEVNLAVAQKAAELLKKEGVIVDILPATIPPGYTADAFVSIHADQGISPELLGFKASPALNNTSQDSVRFSGYMMSEYQKVINMPMEGEITENMTRYYGFNNEKFMHSISADTPGVLIEMGYLTNKIDQEILINNPNLPALGISNGVVRFLNSLN